MCNLATLVRHVKQVESLGFIAQQQARQLINANIKFASKARSVSGTGKGRERKSPKRWCRLPEVAHTRCSRLSSFFLMWLYGSAPGGQATQGPLEVRQSLDVERSTAAQ